MRILFLAPYVPFPILHGGRNRTWGLIRCLARFATVRVMAAGDPGAPEVAESRQRLGALGIALEVFSPTGPGPAEADADDVRRPPDALAHFRCPGLLEALPRAVCEFVPDLVHFEELVMAQYATAVPGPRIVDRQKVEWAFHEAMATDEPGAGAHRREAARFRRYEGEAASHFEQVLVIAEEDRRLLAPFYREDRIHVVPIGVDDGIRRPADRTAEIRHVLLYGTVDYGPNVEANELYLGQVRPALSRVLPELRTLIVGSGTPPPSLGRTDQRVELRGYVTDIAAVLAGPSVLVVPLRVGGGARTKVLEALAAGMPVVSTAVGVEGLGLEPGTHYLRAETPAEMVESVRRLVQEPPLAARLGREGAAWVDRFHRWDVIGRQLEPIYRTLQSGPGMQWAARSHEPRPQPARRALLIGVRPLPEEPDAVGLSFPGHRTAQFGAALREAGCVVESVLLAEEDRFRPGPDLQRLHDAFVPDVVVSAGGYHPARVLVQLETECPRFIDLAGDLPAEAQLRAANGGEGLLVEYLSVLSRALAVGDRFSVVGPSQRLVLLGQLGAAGRLTGSTVGEDPVDVVPLAADGPSSPPPLPPDGFRLLWSGGYNTWMDAETLFCAIERAMASRPDVVFVSTGGKIGDHDEESHARFWARARGSAFAERFLDHGRRPRREALEILEGCHVVLSVSRPCFEAEFGSRQRLVEGLAHARPAVATALGDLSVAIAEAEAGIVVSPGDPSALASAITSLAENRGRLAACAARGRALWERRFTCAATTVALRAWLEEPRRWPPSPLEQTGLADLAADRLRLTAELDAIRGSYTFRALRLLDRLLGRGGGPAR